MLITLLILALSIGVFAGFAWGRLSGNREADRWREEASAWAGLYLQSQIPDLHREREQRANRRERGAEVEREAMAETEIDLSEFCGVERAGHPTPFVVDGFRYATDGFVAIRVPAEGETDTDPKFWGDMKELWKSHVSAPLSPWPEQRYCPQCLDKGTLGCDHCGKRKCLMCNGRPASGQIIHNSEIQIGKQRISVKHDRKIRAFFNLRFVDLPYSGKTLAIPFVFDGGEGLVLSRFQEGKAVRP